MKRLLLFALFRIASSALAVVPGKDLTQYAHESWTVQHGLPGASVFSIVQTTDGYLWLRTSSGLVRFDGTTFKLITPVVDDKPVNELVRAICLDPSGNLLVRTRTELLIYQNQGFHRLMSGAIPGGIDRHVRRDRAGNVWIGADNDLFVSSPTGFTHVVHGAGGMGAIFEDRDGGMWFGSSSGTFYYRDGELTTYLSGPNSTMVQPVVPSHAGTSAPGGIPLSSVENPTAIAQDHEGAIWIGARYGLFRVKDGKVTAEPQFADGVRKQIRAIYEDRHHTLWVGTTTSGLYRRTGDKWTNFRHRDGLTDDSVTSIFEDREGSLWVGTSFGLDRFRDTPVVPFTPAQGLYGEVVSAIVRGKDDAMYVFCTGAGLTEIRPGTTRHYGNQDGIEVNASDKLLAARDGTIWLGTPAGVCWLKDGQLHRSLAQGKLRNIWISAIGEDDEGFYIGTGELKLYRFSDDQLTPFTLAGRPTPFATRSTYFFTFLRDDNDVTWAGTTVGLDVPGGLYRMQRSPFSIQHIDSIDFSVTGICDDHAGYLWLTGDTPGIVRYRKLDGNIVRFTEANGLLTNDINCVVADRKGDLWLGTAIGIVHVKRAELDAIALGSHTPAHAVLFDTNDGMLTSETSGNRAQPGACVAGDGKIWFGTPKGIAIVDPEHIERNAIAPPVVIEKVVRNGVDVPLGHGLKFEAGTERLEFQYNGLSLLVPSRVKFEYKLDGYDTEWIDAGTRRAAFYTHLPPGEYTFHVIACNNDGLWNTVGASQRFVQRPHFYQTQWFFALCGTAGLGLIWVGYRVRTRQLTRRQKLLEQVVEERTRSLADEIKVRKAAEAEAERIHKELLIASHRAGMAEMATAVLHNVGNTLNSVGVSSRVLMQTIQRSRVVALQRIIDLVSQNVGNLAEYLTSHPKGKLVPNYLLQLSKELGSEHATLDGEIVSLDRHIEELRKFVAMQQTYARASGPTQEVAPSELVDEAIKANGGIIAQNGVQIVTDYQTTATLCVDKPKALQILADIVSNAIDATIEAQQQSRPVHIRVTQSGPHIAFAVTDEGVGIPPENLEKIFSSGFTTKKGGHGFGLHSGILAARQMGGNLTASSLGVGKGAIVTLVLPVRRTVESGP